jgi:hypothetical protein
VSVEGETASLVRSYFVRCCAKPSDLFKLVELEPDELTLEEEESLRTLLLEKSSAEQPQSKERGFSVFLADQLGSQTLGHAAAVMGKLLGRERRRNVLEKKRPINSQEEDEDEHFLFGTLIIRADHLASNGVHIGHQPHHTLPYCCANPEGCLTLSPVRSYHWSLRVDPLDLQPIIRAIAHALCDHNTVVGVCPLPPLKGDPQPKAPYNYLCIPLDGQIRLVLDHCTAPPYNLTQHTPTQADTHWLEPTPPPDWPSTSIAKQVERLRDYARFIEYALRAGSPE